MSEGMTDRADGLGTVGLLDSRYLSCGGAATLAEKLIVRSSHRLDFD